MPYHERNDIFGCHRLSKDSDTRQRLLTTLQNLQYTTFECLLTPLQFEVPNSRLRYYLLAKMKPMDFTCLPDSDNEIWRHIPSHVTQERSDRSNDTNSNVMVLKQYLDDGLSWEDSPYAVPDRILEKWGRLFDIVLPTSHRTCCFTRGVYLFTTLCVV